MRARKDAIGDHSRLGLREVGRQLIDSGLIVADLGSPQILNLLGVLEGPDIRQRLTRYFPLASGTAVSFKPIRSISATNFSTSKSVISFFPTLDLEHHSEADESVHQGELAWMVEIEMRFPAPITVGSASFRSSPRSMKVDRMSCPMRR
jgi:hypothetical protein